MALAISKLLAKYKIHWLGDGGAALLLGAVVGGVLRVAGVEKRFGQQLSFKSWLFMIVFMPAMMFHAGYNLDIHSFHRNLGSICLTAFLGTTISTFVIGLMM